MSFRLAVVGSNERVNHVRTPWREALLLPGARQMGNLRRLMESRPFFERIPDQSLIASPVGTRGSHQRATRASGGSYAFIYTPDGQPFDVSLEMISGPTISVGWFNPRNGNFDLLGLRARTNVARFTPPEEGFDWVLVLDDSSRNFPAPSTSSE